MIYVIMVCTKMTQERAGIPDLGATRIVGYYHKKEDAEYALAYNIGDIWEYTYDYAILQEVDEGIYVGVHSLFWVYEYNKEKNGYVKIRKPPVLFNACGIVMG